MISKTDLNRIKILEHRDKNKNYNMNIFAYIPEGNINDMKILFVMSGCLRDALNHLKIWIQPANENKYIIIAPEFDKDHYSIADHEYGNIINIQYDYSTQDIYTPNMIYDTNIKNECNWIYHNIDEIYIEFIQEYNLKNKNIEPVVSLCDRVFRLLDYIKENLNNKKILLVTHSGTARAIEAYFYGINENGDLPPENLKNCEIREYTFKN